MITWLKGQKIKLSPNFSTIEFQCRCTYASCKVQTLDMALVTKLQFIRDELKVSISPTSAYRCSKKQADLSQDPRVETVPNSSHMQGIACDFTTKDLRKAADLANTYFDAVGVSPSFIHVDLRSDKKRRWTYKA